MDPSVTSEEIGSTIKEIINNTQRDEPEAQRRIGIVANYFGKLLKVTEEKSDGRLILYPEID